jgi:hypothetical protein
LKTRRANLFAAAKPIAGMLLLAVVVWWIAHHGEALARIGAAVLFYSTLISAMTVVLNAAVLRLSVRYFRGNLSPRNALRLSALGTLGNALGGLPIGTALKYTLLYQKSGLTIGEITAGLACFSVMTCGWLTLYALLVLGGTPLSHDARLVFLVLAGVALIVLVAVTMYLRTRRRFAALIEPFLRPANLLRAALVSAAITTTFVMNYTVVARFLFPELPTATVVFVASIGTIISMGSVLQTVGGITELSMGLSSLLSGLRAVTGATLALVLRLTAILAAGIVFGALLLTDRNRH